MAKLYNLARVTTSTTGTGPLVLGTAVASFRTFAQAGVQDGDTVSYAIENGPNREVGRGVYAAAGPSLTRGVLLSTNNNNLINIQGNAQVAVTALAEDFVAPSDAVYGRSDGNWLRVVLTGAVAPTARSVGDLWLNTANNTLRVWNGTAWDAIISDAPSSGIPFIRRNAAWEPLKIETLPGVIDGSDAAQGYVGEYLISTNNSDQIAYPNPPGSGQYAVNVPWGMVQDGAPWLTLASLLIPPGDWDVLCVVEFRYSVASLPIPPGINPNDPNFISACISPATVVNPLEDYTFWPRGWDRVWYSLASQVSVNLGPLRVSSASNTNMLLRVQSYYDANAIYYFSARRVR